MAQVRFFLKRNVQSLKIMQENGKKTMVSNGKIPVIFRGFLPNFLLGYASKPVLVCFRASNSLKYQILWGSAPGLQNLPDPLSALMLATFATFQL